MMTTYFKTQRATAFVARKITVSAMLLSVQLISQAGSNIGHRNGANEGYIAMQHPDLLLHGFQTRQFAQSSARATSSENTRLSRRNHALQNRIAGIQAKKSTTISATTQHANKG